MTSAEGYERLQSEPESLKKLVDEISHVEGLFKIKLNPYNDNVYYNILEIYKNDSSILLKKAYKDLKITMKKFLEKTAWFRKWLFLDCVVIAKSKHFYKSLNQNLYMHTTYLQIPIRFDIIYKFFP